VTTAVIVADDQPLMRAALSTCLGEQSDILVVAEAANGAQAVDLVHKHRPDVALIDVRMPVLDGIEATRRIVRERDGRTRVITLTTFELDEYIAAALRAGASGFLLKDATAGEIVHAVRVVAAGDAVLSPTVTRRLLQRYAHLFPSQTDPRVAIDLTPRERDVLCLVAEGLGNAAIASTLHLAESSVKTHVGHLLAKLRVPDRVHLVISAYESGLVQPKALLSCGAPESGRGTG
jgi:DNA-binding NarL/FixJ family response regulator